MYEEIIGFAENYVMTAVNNISSSEYSGLEQAKKILQSTPDIQAYLIYADEKGKNQVYTTPALQTMMDR